MLRAVLDANVLVSALIRPEGTPGKIVSRWLAEKPFELVVSRAIIDEVRRAARYERVRKYMRLSQREAEALLAILQASANLVTGTTAIEGVAVDADDHKVLAAALEGDADFLVTGDQELLALRRHAGFRIITAAAFLAMLD